MSCTNWVFLTLGLVFISIPVWKLLCAGVFGLLQQHRMAENYANSMRKIIITCMLTKQHTLEDATKILHVEGFDSVVKNFKNDCDNMGVSISRMVCQVNRLMNYRHVELGVLLDKGEERVMLKITNLGAVVFEFND